MVGQGRRGSAERRVKEGSEETGRQEGRNAVGNLDPKEGNERRRDAM
jgi:hypothetical protein